MKFILILLIIIFFFIYNSNYEYFNISSDNIIFLSNTETNDIMSLLSYKLDNVISLLETGVTIQDRILLESRS